MCSIIPYSSISFNIHEYKIQNLQYILNIYTDSCSKFFAYMKILRPDPKLQNFGAYINTYQNNWLILVSSILKHYNHVCKGINEKDTLIRNKVYISYDTIVDILNLKITTFQQIDGYKMIWGPVYWKFLHLTSILCATDYHKSLFGTNMLNFNLAMICGQCSTNFKAKKPFALTIVLTISNDTITPIFDLHNTVNQALKKQIYNFKDFLEFYKLSAKYIETININLIN